MTIRIPRSQLAEIVGGNRRLLAVLEQVIDTTDAVESGLASNVEATEKLDQATVIVLSPNAAFANERVLRLGPGLRGDTTANEFTLSATGPSIQGGFTCTLQLVGNSTVIVPLTGQLATTGNVETLRRKTLDAPKLSGVSDYADDAAAAAGGVEVGQMYRTGSAVKVRVA